MNRFPALANTLAASAAEEQTRAARSESLNSSLPRADQQLDKPDFMPRRITDSCQLEIIRQPIYVVGIIHRPSPPAFQSGREALYIPTTSDKKMPHSLFSFSCFCNKRSTKMPLIKGWTTWWTDSLGTRSMGAEMMSSSSSVLRSTQLSK